MNLHMQWTSVMVIFGSSFEGILSNKLLNWKRCEFYIMQKSVAHNLHYN